MEILLKPTNSLTNNYKYINTYTNSLNLIQIILFKHLKMKKIALLLVSALIGANMLVAQTGQTVESLLKAKEKSDQDIQDAKKNIKSATWEKRGDLFLDIAQFLSKGLYQTMPLKGVNGAETILQFSIGKPQNIVPKGASGAEDWIYERITLHFVDGKLDSWDETKPIDPDALDKAYDAYKKAEELDAKGKFRTKTTTKQNIAVLRGLFTNQAVKSYVEQKFTIALKQFEKALDLNQYPKMESDTILNTGLITYYTGMVAQSGKDYTTAEKYYNLCVDKKYEGASPYHGLASLYREMAQHDKELDIIQKGYKLYPNSKELLVDFINYYLVSGQSEAALEKLGQAVKDNPENPTFYYATGTLYDTMEKDSTDKYDAAKKLEFHNLAIANYKKALEIKPDYFESLYNLGALYYNEAAQLLKDADKLPINQKVEFEAKQNQAKDRFRVALPFIEKAHEVQPNDRSTLQTLLTIYHRLQMYDKKKETQEKLDNLPAENKGM
jgi:tetratricopeptide (TPR) repeat protein